ncbi:MAG: sulfite exporter TauE/SafE family protein [Chloroherpetonaceae bacterium]|nr:sulfite exporter TauE/SafE family protein [Chthonomonadaceae bacterium]MDW8208254.1 sulfite exporter TauE/SafE family protein [Chloroherpetonaceae bacterium]
MNVFREAFRGPAREQTFTRIKTAVVFLAGTVTAVSMSVTGIGAQVAMAPMLSWMLGFKPDKAQAIATRYALFVSSGAVIGILMRNIEPDAYFLRGLILMLCATLGAMLAAPLAPRPDMLARRQLLQTIGMGVALFTLLQALRISALHPSIALAQWDQLWQLGLIGLATGTLTQAMGLASGILMVPGVYFVSGLSVHHSVALSTYVILLALPLPVYSYARQGLTASEYSNPAALGGVLGGLTGGYLLGSIPEKGVLIVFALMAMFFCAREVARIAAERSADRARVL